MGLQICTLADSLMFFLFLPMYVTHVMQWSWQNVFNMIKQTQQ